METTLKNQNGYSGLCADPTRINHHTSDGSFGLCGRFYVSTSSLILLYLFIVGLMRYFWGLHACGRVIMALPGEFTLRCEAVPNAVPT